MLAGNGAICHFGWLRDSIYLRIYDPTKWPVSLHRLISNTYLLPLLTDEVAFKFHLSVKLFRSTVYLPFYVFLSAMNLTEPVNICVSCLYALNVSTEKRSEHEIDLTNQDREPHSKSRASSKKQLLRESLRGGTKPRSSGNKKVVSLWESWLKPGTFASSSREPRLSQTYDYM
jgi:hypothetical protein